MKFAVVEYTTKTGQIWKHTPQHPNYLGDPQHEIDPTSFACYTSALAGQHIPLLGFINRTLPARLYKKVTGNWPSGYSLSYLAQFDTLLVVHQLSNAHEMVRFVQRVKKEFPHIVVLGVPTQPFGLLAPSWEREPKAKDELVAFVKSCDAFVSVVKSTIPAWEALTSTHTYYLPQPYPVEYAKHFFKTRIEKEKIIFAAGVTKRPEVGRGFAVAAALQKQFPDYTIWITDTPGETTDLSALGNARYEVRPFEQWREHLASLQRVSLVVNTDFTQTRGRVQVDAAVVGTPSLGADSDGQADLFPDLAATPNTPIETLIAKGVRLLSDPDYYDAQVQTAQTRLEQYNYVHSAERLSSLANQVRRHG